jgi:hypothetical protein
VLLGMGKKSGYRVELEQRARDLGCELEWIPSSTWAVVGDDSGNTIGADGRKITYHGNLEEVERCLDRVAQRGASASTANSQAPDRPPHGRGLLDFVRRR